MSITASKKETEYVAERSSQFFEVRPLPRPAFLLCEIFYVNYEKVELHPDDIHTLTLIKSDGTEIEYTMP